MEPSSNARLVDPSIIHLTSPIREQAGFMGGSTMQEKKHRGGYHRRPLDERIHELDLLIASTLKLQAQRDAIVKRDQETLARHQACCRRFPKASGNELTLPEGTDDTRLWTTCQPASISRRVLFLRYESATFSLTVGRGGGVYDPENKDLRTPRQGTGLP